MLLLGKTHKKHQVDLHPPETTCNKLRDIDN